MAKQILKIGSQRRVSQKAGSRMLPTCTSSCMSITRLGIPIEDYVTQAIKERISHKMEMDVYS